MVTMTSPTAKLILEQRNGVTMRETRQKTEVETLRDENDALRRKLAHLTAQYIWAEGGSFAKINDEIRQYGYRLERMDGAYDPRIVPITKVVKESVEKDVDKLGKVAGVKLPNGYPNCNDN